MTGVYLKSRRKLPEPYNKVAKFATCISGHSTVNYSLLRARYLEALKFMLDPNTKSIFETETVNPDIVNKRKRTPLMLCFTSPHFTLVAKENGLEKDPDTGRAIPLAKRPQTAQVRKGVGRLIAGWLHEPREVEVFGIHSTAL